jgi:hypothetical protein
MYVIIKRKDNYTKGLSLMTILSKLTDLIFIWKKFACLTMYISNRGQAISVRYIASSFLKGKPMFLRK